MKLKNKEINEMAFAIESLGNRTSDVKLRFDLAKKTKAILEEKKDIDKNVNNIIKKRNEEDSSVTSINIFDDEYVALMDYDNEIKFDGLKLSYLSQFNPSMEELLALEKIIVDR